VGACCAHVDLFYFFPCCECARANGSHTRALLFVYLFYYYYFFFIQSSFSFQSLSWPSRSWRGKNARWRPKTQPCAAGYKRRRPRQVRHFRCRMRTVHSCSHARGRGQGRGWGRGQRGESLLPRTSAAPPPPQRWTPVMPPRGCRGCGAAWRCRGCRAAWRGQRGPDPDPRGGGGGDLRLQIKRVLSRQFESLRTARPLVLASAQHPQRPAPVRLRWQALPAG
jgi:hypothetical protein